MNAAARWLRSPELLFGRCSALNVLPLLALALAVLVGVLSGADSTPNAYSAIVTLLLPALMVAMWWGLAGGRALSLCFNAYRARLPRLPALLLRALGSWLALTVLLPAVLLAARNGHFATASTVLLDAAVVGISCTALSRFGGQLLGIALLIAMMLLGRAFGFAAILDPVLVPWGLAAAAVLLALTATACTYGVRRIGVSRWGAWTALYEAAGDFGAQCDIATQSGMAVSVRSTNTPWQRFAAALGPPWAPPSLLGSALQMLTVALMAVFYLTLGAQQNGHPIPLSPWLLILLMMAASQSAIMIQRRLSGAASALAMLPGLGTPAQCRRRACLGILRSLSLYALYVLLTMLGMAIYQHMPWWWMAWTALWTLPLLALGVIGCIYAIHAAEIPQIPLYVLGFLVALPATIALTISRQPGVGMATIWCVFTALVALLGWLVWRSWRRRTHPLLPH